MFGIHQVRQYRQDGPYSSPCSKTKPWATVLCRFLDFAVWAVEDYASAKQAGARCSPKTHVFIFFQSSLPLCLHCYPTAALVLVDQCTLSEYIQQIPIVGVVTLVPESAVIA